MNDVNTIHTCWFSINKRIVLQQLSFSVKALGQDSFSSVVANNAGK